MLYDYIINNYTDGEPIFLEELPGNSKGYIRQEMKQLADNGKLERVYNGVYFLPYITILGTKGKVSVEKYVEKKFLYANGETSGYITGLQFANLCGLTTQSPACIEVCTNSATTRQRSIEIDGRRIIIYKPVATITEANKSALQFLNLMTAVDRYSEIQSDSLRLKLKELVKSLNINFNQVREYISLFPDKVFKNFYQGGLMRELVS